MSSFNRLLSNTAYLTATNGVNLVAAFIFGKLSSQYLGDEGFGRLFFILSLTSFFEAMMRGSVSMVLTQKISHKKDEATYYWWPYYLFISLYSSVYVAVIVYAWLTHSNPVMTLAFAFSALLSVARLCGDGAVAFQRGWDQFAPEFRTTILERFIFICLFIFLIRSTSSREVAHTTGLIAIFAINAGTQILQSILLIVPVWKKFRPAFTINRYYINDLIRNSKPLWVCVPLVVLHGRIEIFLLHHYELTKELGYFGSVNKLMDAERMIPWILCMALFPSLSRKASQSSEGFSLAYLTIFKVLITIALPMTAILVVFAPLIIRLAYTEEFLPATVPFILMTCAMVPVFLSTLYNYGVIALEKQQLILKAYLWTVLIHLVAGYLLIPSYGAVGASISFVIGEVVLMGISFVYIRREVDTLSFSHLSRPLMLVALTGIALVIGYRHSPTAGLILSLLVYSTFMGTVGIFTRTEIDWFRSFRKTKDTSVQVESLL